MSWFTRKRSALAESQPLTVGDYLEQTIRSPHLRALMDGTTQRGIALAASGSTELADRIVGLRGVLEKAEAVDPKAWTRLAEASQEAAKPEPDVGEIVTLLDQAARYAQGAPGFARATAELIDRVGPAQA